MKHLPELAPDITPIELELAKSLDPDQLEQEGLLLQQEHIRVAVDPFLFAYNSLKTALDREGIE